MLLPFRRVYVPGVLLLSRRVLRPARFQQMLCVLRRQVYFRRVLRPGVLLPFRQVYFRQVCVPALLRRVPCVPLPKVLLRFFRLLLYVLPRQVFRSGKVFVRQVFFPDFSGAVFFRFPYQSRRPSCL